MSFLDTLPNDLKNHLTSSLEKCSANGHKTELLGIIEKIFDYAADSGAELKRKKSKLNTKLDGDAKTNIFTLKDVSVVSPIRKKLDFLISFNTNTKSPEIYLSKDNVPQLCISNLMQNISFATFLPVPEKKNLSYLLIQYKTSTDPSFTEPVLLSLNKDAVIKQFAESKFITVLPGNTNTDTNFQQCIDYIRKQAILTGFRITDPFNVNGSDRLNSQQVPSFHINCHRTTKEGTLYFLPEHIIFGFKKPVLIFKAQEVESITYSSITRLTFSCTLVQKDSEKTEFSMIDQSDYNKIDEYVKSKEVIDKSMSAELKAKPVSKQQTSAQDGESALAAAEKELLGASGTINDAALGSDDDDEEDENFVGESDLSDGSENSEEGAQSDNDMDVEQDEEEDEQEEDQNQSTFSHPNISATTEGYSIEAEDDDDDDDDDDEDDEENDSGAEYA